MGEERRGEERLFIVRTYKKVKENRASALLKRAKKKRESK